jgi:flavodoxin
MHKPISSWRRHFLATSALSGLATASRPVQAAPTIPDSRVLVAYFSRSGNTRVIAGQLQRARKAALFEIEPTKPYPADYLATVEQARRERDQGYLPPLKAKVPGIASFDTIYLGLPIWGGTAPPVIRAFLAAHELKGKTIIPFITHGGYGIGDCLKVLAAHAPGAQLRDGGLVMEADQERQTMERVQKWLSDSG